MLEGNIVIAIIIIVLFIVLALVGFGIYFLQTRAFAGRGTVSETSGDDDDV